MSTPTTDRPRLDLRSGPQRVFAHVLASSLVVSVANFTVWFAVTFWTYLETRSVLATGLIGGIIGLLVTVLALLSRPYRRLSAVYAEGSKQPAVAVAVSSGE